MNLLFVLDWIVFLPFTLIRLGVIYFNGSKYNVNGLKFLDVMMHADNKYFNQNLESELEPSIDTIKDDARKIIKYDSHIYEMTEIKKRDIVETQNIISNNNSNNNSNSNSNSNSNNNSNNDKNREMSENYVLDTEMIKDDSDTDNNESSSDSDDSSTNSEDSHEYNDSDELSENIEPNKEKDLRFLIKNAKEKINIMMMK
jgi:hypothetical protein